MMLDPEYASEIRRQRVDVLVTLALEMLGAPSADFKRAASERLAKVTPRRSIKSKRKDLVKQQERRARNTAAGLCINENKAGTHGPATHGCRCEACWRAHRRTA